jgi:hypothetical protein
MSLTHVDPHVSEIVMVWIQIGDLLMVWIQISLLYMDENSLVLLSNICIFRIGPYCMLGCIVANAAAYVTPHIRKPASPKPPAKFDGKLTGSTP